MTTDETLDLAHREAWRYKKSSDPHHSDTYTFNRSTLLEFARKLAIVELTDGELRCAATPVLLDGLHEYTALKVQAMMMDAISMRSNVEFSGGAPLHGAASAGTQG